ncbi:hypothetical protein BZA70DRAFT_273745 [Myxozyma melibiosi]|uniref:Uncharacterized protein n=1 Tax=Myxozyma melibiosi TaxID=54550 RepID=A0ABR1FF10_9ASCO
MQQAVPREAPSPLLLATSPSCLPSPTYLSISGTTPTISPSPSPLLSASSSSTGLSSSYQRHQLKSRNPTLSMAMPPSPRFPASAFSRVYGQNPISDISSDTTPYLVPVGSPSGPVTPMQLADEEFQFPVAGTSPLTTPSYPTPGISASASQSNLQSSLGWRQRQQTISKPSPSNAFQRGSKYSQSAFSRTTNTVNSNNTGPGFTTTSSFLTAALNASAYAADVSQLRRQPSNGASSSNNASISAAAAAAAATAALPSASSYLASSSPSPLASPRSPWSPSSPAMSDGDVEEMEDLRMDGV